MELRQLEYFQMVSRLNSFTRAAEQLHVAQPSITNAIHKLERELNVQLFDRSQKKISLTVEGALFLARIDPILFALNQATIEMHDIANLNKGSIHFGVPPMIGAYLFPNMFTRFKKNYPQLDLTVFEEGSLATCSRLENGELDLGLVILPQASESLEMRPILKEEIVLCVAVDHPLAASGPISFEQLRDEPFILLKEDFYHRKVIIEECQKYGFPPHILFSSSQIETVKAMVVNNIGISFLMGIAIEDNPKIVAVPLKSPIEITIGLTWKKGKYLSKAAWAFIEYIEHYPSNKPDS